MNILITGSAGYIGSHACLKLIEEGHRIVGVDNYSRGNRGATEFLTQYDDIGFIEIDIRNEAELVTILVDHDIEAVMHFAAFAYVGESCHKTLLYYNNNLCGSLSLLGAMRQAGVSKLVFSSTCATYGEPPFDQIPIGEDCDQKPINPYGRSKLMVEQVIRDFSNSSESPNDFCFVILRYFNVAGADPQGRIGELHDPETHLIPLCLETALGKKDCINIFGTDYPTPDGTCIRDYIHVVDLIDAHVMALKELNPGDQRYYNIGTGIGCSVKEVIETCKHVTQSDFATYELNRRSGDPPVLYADSSVIQTELGWKPQHGKLEKIITDAWRWMMVLDKGGDFRKGAWLR